MQPQTDQTAPLFQSDDLICAYSRAQALSDGMLIDVSPPARALGIRYPLAVTARVWAELVEYPGADMAWALRSLLCVCVAQLRRAKSDPTDSDRLAFQAWRKGRPVAVQLICGPGDDEAPVLTLLLDGED